MTGELPMSKDGDINYALGLSCAYAAERLAASWRI